MIEAMGIGGERRRRLGFDRLHRRSGASAGSGCGIGSRPLRGAGWRRCGRAEPMPELRPVQPRSGDRGRGGDRRRRRRPGPAARRDVQHRGERCIRSPTPSPSRRRLARGARASSRPLPPARSRSRTPRATRSSVVSRSSHTNVAAVRIGAQLRRPAERMVVDQQRSRGLREHRRSHSRLRLPARTELDRQRGAGNHRERRRRPRPREPETSPRSARRRRRPGIYLSAASGADLVFSAHNVIADGNPDAFAETDTAPSTSAFIGFASSSFMNNATINNASVTAARRGRQHPGRAAVRQLRLQRLPPARELTDRGPWRARFFPGLPRPGRARPHPGRRLRTSGPTSSSQQPRRSRSSPRRARRCRRTPRSARPRRRRREKQQPKAGAAAKKKKEELRKEAEEEAEVVFGPWPTPRKPTPRSGGSGSGRRASTARSTA